MTPDAKAREIAEKIFKEWYSTVREVVWTGERERLISAITAALTRSEEEKKCEKCQTPKTKIPCTEEYFGCRVCVRDEIIEKLDNLIDEPQSCVNHVQDMELFIVHLKKGRAEAQSQLSTLTARLKDAERIIEALRREAGYRSIKTPAMLDAESFLAALHQIQAQTKSEKE